MRNVRRRSTIEGGINKRGTPRRRTLGGIVGDQVFIPGSPIMTVPELLQQAERTVEYLDGTKLKGKEIRLEVAKS